MSGVQSDRPRNLAGDIVVCENLERSLKMEEEAALVPYSDQLSRLKGWLKIIKDALIAVEAGERMDGNEVIQCRLPDLTVLLLRADDLLDVIVNPCDQRRLKGMAMAAPLKRISLEIEHLAQQLNGKFCPTTFPDREFNAPLLVVPDRERVIGRHKEIVRIRDRLLCPERNRNSKTNVSVIPILGRPGIGKSTLLKNLYLDEQVMNHFELRIWIQVSDIIDGDEGKIIQRIVECCTREAKSKDRDIFQRNKLQIQKSKSKKNEGITTSCNLLGCQSFDGSVEIPNLRNTTIEIYTNTERRLQREILGKLYLLVLEDAHIKHWSRLKDLLGGGAAGSQILVTTRSLEVASLAKLQTDEIVELGGLSIRNSMRLFRKSAFQQGVSVNTEFERIGKSIATSCNGVPLAIRVAGSLLCGRNWNKWISVDNDIAFINREGENDVMDHILDYCYNDLPYRLKACIGYCSLFPEDFELSKHDLISLWIAQGFVESQNDQSLQQNGERYFRELSRLHFFQDFCIDDLGDIVTCKMNPTMRVVARKKAAGVLNLDLADKGVHTVLASTAKHISFWCDSDSLMKVPQSVLRAQFLRTFVSVTTADCDAKIDRLACRTLISKLQCLRVLDLHDLGIDELPDSIGKLIHLRYLDISKNDRLMTLPRSVTKLHNLQTLKLNSCLKLMGLPGNYGQLVKLRRLEIDECDSLTCMPTGLEKLTQLEWLSSFVVGKHYARYLPPVGLQAVKNLNQLKGRLEIKLRGQYWKANIDEGSQAYLTKKTNLVQLSIKWVRSISDVEILHSGPADEENLNYKEFLEHLQPHPNLKTLCIEGYKGEDFPNWAMSASSLNNLVVISIGGCNRCRHLPPFGELPSLKRLTLRHMGNVQYMERDSSSAGDGNQEAIQVLSPLGFFKSLEELTLHNLYKLKGWRKEMIFTPGYHPSAWIFPKLSKLRIWNCPNLISIPLFLEVSDLDLQNVNQKLLEECAKKTAITCQQPTNVSCIKSLQIHRCPSLNNFEAVRKGLGGLPQLEKLVIRRCDALTSLSSGLQYLASLKRLEISNCENLQLCCDAENEMCDSNTSSWISLTLHSFVATSPWASLYSLRLLSLSEIPKMKTLPDGLKHAKTLQYLWISACYALVELPEWIGSLTVLQHLRIESCPGVKRFPNGIKGVRSLMKVEITECPELMERCRKQTGEDWHKVKHARIFLHNSWRYGIMSS